MHIINEYLTARKKLYTYFNYTGCDYGIEVETSAYWKINEDEVMWSEEPFEDEAEYSNEVRKVYRTEDLTMILVYSYTGEKYLQVFDNSKELK